MLRSMLRRQALVALCIVVASVAAAILIVKDQAGPVTSLVSSGEPVGSLEECQKAAAPDFRCYATHLANKTYYEGREPVFAEIKTAYESDQYIKAECHQLTHIVGRTAYKKLGGLDKAYAQGDSFCWSGYYHGAIEQAITDIGGDKIKADAPAVCKSFAEKRPYSFDHFNCVHGLGHGLMAVGSYNLPDSLELCDVLETDWDRSSCYGGVFMENVMVASRGNGVGAYFKDSEPLYPCTFVKAAYKEQCYLMQTSRVLQKNGYDFTKTFAECEKADVGFTNTCYRSLGRDASGSTISDKDRTIATCQLAPNREALEGCTLGAVRDFVSYYHSDQQALALCDGFGGDIGEMCKRDVAQYYKAF